ncbi:MAG: NAD(P)H-dependent flavin oxidoreductase YrpB (nitropropane dioxygenase family) [Candidatus Poriferisodalaceae bacterium]
MLRDELAEIRRLVGDRPFGVDLVLPPGMPEHNSREAIEAHIPEGHRSFVNEIIDKYDVPEPSGPGMRTRFIRSAEIEADQLEAVMQSDVDIFACGIGAPRPAVDRARELGKMTSTEHTGHMAPELVDKLLAATSADTVITRSESGKTFRQIRSAWSDEWERADAPSPLKMPYQDVLVGDLRGAIDEHKVGPLLHSGAGQGIGYATQIRPVAEIMAELVADATATIEGLRDRR